MKLTTKLLIVGAFGSVIAASATGEIWGSLIGGAATALGFLMFTSIETFREDRKQRKRNK